MQTAGIILDLYDDRSGRVLREKLAGRDLPKELAEVELLPTEKLASLPDRLFALVAIDDGEKFRKYAMHDEGHLATSIIYFLECGHLFPEEAQKVAAQNLVNACAWYDFDPPEPLVKRAFLGKAITAGLGALDIGSKIQSGASKMRSDMSQIASAGVKTADLNGTEMMPMTASSKRPMRANTAGGVTSTKTAASILTERLEAGWIGPIDITGLSAPVQIKTAQATRFCLPDRGSYPIDSMSQIKTAEAFLNEHWGKFDLMDRRIFSANLIKRAEEVGVAIHGIANRYAGHGYGTKIAGELRARIRNYEDMGFDVVYSELLEKVASTPPEEMAEMLRYIDKESGASDAWNHPFNGFLDPYQAVFSKTASDDMEPGVAAPQWSWTKGSDYVNDVMLCDLPRNRRRDVVKTFGEDFTKELEKDPIKHFKSLDDSRKVAVARLASQNNAGSYRKT